MTTKIKDRAIEILVKVMQRPDLTEAERRDRLGHIRLLYEISNPSFDDSVNRWNEIWAEVMLHTKCADWNVVMNKGKH